MSIFNPALAIPDSLLAKEATVILHEHSTDLLFNRSIRVYLFARHFARLTPHARPLANRVRSFTGK